MTIIDRIAPMREASRAARARGQRVALVPTMGYLHEGHLELVRRARALADWVVVSIFVNPTQFGPGEDLDRYPRDLPRDTELCRREGVDVVFTPTPGEMYPDGFQTYVTVEGLSQPLCGASRPGHFRGVATVVAKLLHIVEPDVAVFGQKDYQQLQVIRRMVRDLSMGLEIEGVPTVREAGGLARSSRNAYLTEEERGRALGLSRALAQIQAEVTAGEDRVGVLVAGARRLLEEAGIRVDYLEVRDPESLEPVERIRARAVAAVAARVGKTRLIDNRVIEAPDPRDG